MLQDRLTTGVPGLEQVLYSGLVPNRAYIVRGEPHSGFKPVSRHRDDAGLLKRTAAL